MKPFVVIAALLLESAAYAQVTPTPITQAKGATFLAVHGVSNVGGYSTFSKVIDLTGYAGIYVGVSQSGPCSQDSYIQINGAHNANVPPADMEGLTSIDSSRRYVVSGISTYYWVGPLPNYISVEASPYARASANNPTGCIFDVFVTPVPLSAGSIVSGPLMSGSSFMDATKTGRTYISPVLTGGLDITTGTVQTMAVTGWGQVLAGGFAPDGAPLDMLGGDGKYTTFPSNGQFPMIMGAVQERTDAPPGRVGLARSLRATATGQLLTYAAPMSMVPAAPTTLAMAANVSNAVTGLPAGSTVEASCYADCTFTAGTGTPVASSTDNPLWARSTRRLTLLLNQTAVAYWCSAATTCQVSTIPVGP